MSWRCGDLLLQLFGQVAVPGVADLQAEARARARAARSQLHDELEPRELMFPSEDATNRGLNSSFVQFAGTRRRRETLAKRLSKEF